MRGNAPCASTISGVTICQFCVITRKGERNFRNSGSFNFKNAFFDAHDRFFNGQHFSQVDHSKTGTLFAGAGLAVVYAFTKNWYLNASYDFNWIRSASHIWNTDHTPADASAATPSRIANSAIVTHTPGLNLIYKFD